LSNSKKATGRDAGRGAGRGTGRGAGRPQRRTYNCSHVEPPSPTSSVCSHVQPKMPRTIGVEMLHPVHKEDGVYKITTKKIGDISIDISDWFVKEEEEVLSQTRAFIGTFERRLFQEANKYLDSVFAIEEKNIFKKSKIFYFKTNSSTTGIYLKTAEVIINVFSFFYRKALKTKGWNGVLKICLAFGWCKSRTEPMTEEDLEEGIIFFLRVSPIRQRLKLQHKKKGRNPTLIHLIFKHSSSGSIRTTMKTMDSIMG